MDSAAARVSRTAGASAAAGTELLARWTRAIRRTPPIPYGIVAVCFKPVAQTHAELTEAFRTSDYVELVDENGSLWPMHTETVASFALRDL